MTIFNILIAFNGSESAIAALKYGASIAQEHSADVTAVLAHAAQEDYVTESRYIPPETRQIIANANSQVLDEIEARFENLRPELGLNGNLHFARLPGRVDRILAETARTYDMIVLGSGTNEPTDSHVTIHPDRIALLSGRPVLVVPSSVKAAADFSHALLAWDGGRSAARAMSDSMQLIQEGGQITILTVGDVVSPQQIERLESHLKRHGVKVAHLQKESAGSVGETILSSSDELAPDVLVMGAYEHSKFREDFLGGVTATVTNRCSIPTLLSH